MANIHTVPAHEAGLPVRAVRVEVLSGPDVGLKHVASTDTTTVGTATGNDIVLRDPKVSRYHLELRPLAARIQIWDRGSTNGTTVGPAVVRDGSVTCGAGTDIVVGGTILRIGDGGVVVLPVSGPEAATGLVGESPQMRALNAKIERLAQNDAPVLILGESGTGKELVARAIARLGARSDQAFVTIDCAALTPSLVASELFGHERGAFTGADRVHVGAFERADGGTLFIDELGELPAPLQATLLGALERQSFRRVGGTKEIHVNVRLVSATNNDLRARVNAGTFRLDLYYRLAVVLLGLPPLRERPSDVPVLVEHMLREAGYHGPMQTLFDPEALAALKVHPWPGNVRELRNMVLRTLATGESPQVDPLGNGGPPCADVVGDLVSMPYKAARRALLDHFERRYLEALLQRAGSVRAAAREAQMDRSYLTELLRRHGIGRGQPQQTQ